MLKIAFFNRPLSFEEGRDVFERHDRFIHYGVLSIATYLKSKGFLVKIFDYCEKADPETLRSVKKDILQFNPDIVGISSFTTDIYNASATAGFVKKVLKNKVRTVVGGAHISALPSETMEKFTNFDIGVIGEGELTLEEIARKKSLNSIKGIIYRNKNRKIIRNSPRDELADINKLPLPKYELLNLKKHIQLEYQGFLRPKIRKLVLPIETSRGCPFNCKFCFRTLGRKIRLKEPKIVVREIKRIISKYKVDQVEVIDGTFGLSKSHAIKICELLSKEKINSKFKFLIRTRVDTLDKEIINGLKKAGCFIISLGIEAGDDSILEKSGKGITVKKIRETLTLISKADIEIHSNFILGLPFETEQDIIKKAFFAKSLPILSANFAILVPFPGTEIYRLAKEKKLGYCLATEDYRLFGKQGGRALINQRISQKRMKELQTYCYNSFYFSSAKRFLVFLSHLDRGRLWGILNYLSKKTKEVDEGESH